MIDYAHSIPRARFSALQRAEIAEIVLLTDLLTRATGFSALQRAEIAEIQRFVFSPCDETSFQCSSTSRNC